MDFISVKEAAIKFGISERRVQKLCEAHRIEGAEMVSGVWLIPTKARKPQEDERTVFVDSKDYLSLKEVCDELSISIATGRNWVKLGKIVPEFISNKTVFFSSSYIEQYKIEIQNGAKTVLKSRRNKKFITGNSLYSSYVSENCESIKDVQILLNLLNQSTVVVNEEVIQILVADCAIKLFMDKCNMKAAKPECVLTEFLDGRVSFGVYNQLIFDLLENKELVDELRRNEMQFFANNFKFERGEDILGLLYISCKNIGHRKATGSYYTPTKVVKQLITKVVEKNKDGKKILDPCCGTGNFLLQLPARFEMNQIYGNDIDLISIKIARINMALKFDNVDLGILYANFTNSNYLSEFDGTGYDLIVGNPPWGFAFTDKEKIYLRNAFTTARGNSIESYDLFLEKALTGLKKNGVLSFVLPEAILNVKAHLPIRKMIVASSSIQFVEFMGNVFNQVNCPCIIFQLKHTDEKITTKGMEIFFGTNRLHLRKKWNISPDCFSLKMSDEEHKVLQKISGISNMVTLQDKSVFALGIVTGNNKKFISKNKSEEVEVILKGSDIFKYKVKETDNYIKYQPKKFQQCAAEECYRAPKKLLYRFICNQLVFACDDKQMLSLNSCNIVIPNIKGINIKYILAVLNSRIAQFFFEKKFNSVKVLRAHIEQIPIPKISVSEQNEVISLVEEIENEINAAERIVKYENIDEKIRVLYGLNDLEYLIIKKTVDENNNFLS